MKKTISVILVLLLTATLFACSNEDDGASLPLDTQTLRALSEEYDADLIFEERERSEDRVNFVLKNSTGNGSDAFGIITGKDGRHKIVNMTVSSGAMVPIKNKDLFKDAMITPENIEATIDYIAKVYGLESGKDFYDTFAAEFPDKNTEVNSQDGKDVYNYETEVNGTEFRLRFNSETGSDEHYLFTAAMSSKFSAFGL